MSEAKEMKGYLREKQNELIWALHKQGYNGAQIAELFNINRMRVARTIERMPEDWETRWVKR